MCRRPPHTKCTEFTSLSNTRTTHAHACACSRLQPLDHGHLVGMLASTRREPTSRPHSLHIGMQHIVQQLAFGDETRACDVATAQRRQSQSARNAAPLTCHLNSADAVDAISSLLDSIVCIDVHRSLDFMVCKMSLEVMPHSATSSVSGDDTSTTVTWNSGV